MFCFQIHQVKNSHWQYMNMLDPHVLFKQFLTSQQHSNPQKKRWVYLSQLNLNLKLPNGHGNLRGPPPQEIADLFRGCEAHHCPFIIPFHRRPYQIWWKRWHWEESCTLRFPHDTGHYRDRGFGSTTLDCATFDQSYAGDISDLTLSEVDLLKVDESMVMSFLEVGRDPKKIGWS